MAPLSLSKSAFHCAQPVYRQPGSSCAERSRVQAALNFTFGNSSIRARNFNIRLNLINTIIHVHPQEFEVAWSPEIAHQLLMIRQRCPLALQQ